MTPYAQGKRWTLYVGDCLDVLPELEAESFDAVVTDPPFSINTKSDGTGKLDPWADKMNAARWYVSWLSEGRRLIKPAGALWSCLNWRSLTVFDRASATLGWSIESMLVWDKKWIGPGGCVGLRPSYEMVSLWAGSRFSIEDRGLPDIQPFPWSSQKPSGHPAEKPVALGRWLVQNTIRSGDGLVLDMFAGSGTFGEAALSLGHRFVGVEMNERWAESVARRLAQAESDGVQGNLFSASKEDRT